MSSVTWFKKKIFISLLTMFLLVSLFFPKNVQAQFVVSDIPSLLFHKGKWVVERYWELMKKAWEHGGAVAYRNAVNVYLGQMAKQTAEWVATGGKGQKPMFITDPDYWTKMGDQVLGNWIDETAKSVTGFTGKSLCDPIDPTIKFKMLVGFDPKYQEMMFDPKVRCSWSTITARVIEASKKKLFDFDIELKQGQAGTYRSFVAQQIENNPSMASYIKADYLRYLAKFDNINKEIEPEIDGLVDVLQNKDKFSKNDLSYRKTVLEKSYNDLKTNLTEFKNLPYIGKAKTCFSNGKAVYCKDMQCRDICGLASTSNPIDDENNCATTTNNCESRFKNISDVAERIIDGNQNILDGVQKVLSFYEDLTPDTPVNLKDINSSFNPEASDIAVSFKAESNLFEKQAKAIEKSKFIQGLSGDVNRLTSKISDLTLTPGSAIRSQFEESIKKGSAGPVEYTGVAVADAIGVFTNTLVNKLLKQLFEKGFNPDISPEIVERSAPFLGDDQASAVNPTQKQKEALYSDLAVAQVKRGQEISIYDEFTVCPDEKKYRLPTNCLFNDKLARAMEEGLTIREAMEYLPSFLLNPNETVGKPGVYEGLLSWSNLKKLRRYRIFPLGLEIAAEKIFNGRLVDINGTPINKDISLKQIVDEFNNSNPDNQFYHLVDPNWVLKASTYQCGAQGYSAIPMVGSAQRQETCLDLQDCIQENEQGECETWAYCTREKNIWRMDGVPCDSYYNTCQSYRDKNNKEFHFLKNTLDFAECNQNNAGCQWYCSNWDQNLGSLGNWSCLEPGISQKIDREEECVLSNLCADNDGCLCEKISDVDGIKRSCLVSYSQNQCSYQVYISVSNSENVLLFNNKIEKCSEKEVGCQEYIRTKPINNKSDLGTNLLFNGGFEIDNDQNSFPDHWERMTITEELKINQNRDYVLSGSNSLYLKTSDIGQGITISNAFIIPQTDYTLTANVYTVSGKPALRVNNGGLSEPKQGSLIGKWEKISLSFKAVTNLVDIILSSAETNGEYYFDNIKLEVGLESSLYQDYGQVNKIYLKDALNCESKEVGCELYKPINNGLTIPGIIKEQDKCSLNCLGYETFLETASNFNPNSRWVNFIPSRAKTCFLPGCEEFTNMEKEKIEYYSYLRQCVKTNIQDQAIIDNDGSSFSAPVDGFCEFYYTWVGSENTGYQLKKYYLKKSDIQYLGDPDAFGPIKVSENPNPEWGLCDENHINNPHCKQFYDANGKIYYRLYNNTISCSADCISYRRSGDEESIQMAIPSQGEICSKKDLNCREYQGPAANNIRQVFKDNFESSDLKDLNNWDNGEISNVSVNYPGYSMLFDATHYGKTNRAVFNLIQKDKTYLLSLWVYPERKNLTIGFTSLGDLKEFTNLKIGEWQEIKVGPFYFEDIDSNEKLTIEGNDSNYYLDNIILTETQDNLYLIKDSWQTPCECDTLNNHQLFSTNAKKCSVANVADYSMIGCQVYQDRAGQKNYLKSFNKLCSEAAVGCEALIDTKNSAWPFEKTFNLENSSSKDDVSVSADELVYLINNSSKSCDSKNKGCQRFGKPKIDSDGKIISYQDVYLVNNPDKYQNSPTLCLFKDLGCEEYQGGIYFKDPKEKICEYRKDVPINTTVKSGWFKIGTNQPCYYNSNQTPYEPNGITYGIYFNNESGYKGWVGVCPASQTGCTEFIDPAGINLVSNSGFEEDDFSRNSEKLYQWYLSPIGSGIEVKQLNNNGQNILDLNDHSGGANGFAKILIKAEPNMNYLLQADGKRISSTSGTQSISLEFWDSRRNNKIVDYSESFNSIDWETRSINKKSPMGTGYVRIIISSSGSGISEYYWDNIKLINLDSKQGKYYYLNNEKIDKTLCQYRAGLKEGCVLFNDTSKNKDTLSYDSVASYALSRKNNDLLVSAISTDLGKGDSNIAIKVRRDRVCGEWLSCVGSRVIWDKTSGSYRNECEFVGRCQELVGSGESAQCAHIVYDTDPQVLTEDLYKNRNVSWSGMDYSGHSLYNMYPVERLYAVEGTCVIGSKIGKACFSNSDCPNGGENSCQMQNGIYQVTFDGNSGAGVDGLGKTIKKICQIFPEKDSPFSQAMGGEGKNYPEVNVCNETGGINYHDCQCSYIKVDYSGVTKYYNYNKTDFFRSICVSGSKEELGNECSTNSDCGSAGQCAAVNKVSNFVGIRGWCLEKDESQLAGIGACLTWWPGPGIGDPDISQQDLDAGQNLSNDTYYCLETKNRKINKDRFFCEEADGEGNCLTIIQVPKDSEMISQNENSPALINYKEEGIGEYEINPQTSVNGINLSSNMRAILNSGVKFLKSSFNPTGMGGGKVGIDSLKKSYILPPGKFMIKYQWDARTAKTVVKSRNWCGNNNKCGKWRADSVDYDWVDSCNREFPGWHNIDYACCWEGTPNFDGDNNDDNDDDKDVPTCSGTNTSQCGSASLSKERRAKIWCNPGTESYYVTSVYANIEFDTGVGVGIIKGVITETTNSDFYVNDYQISKKYDSDLNYYLSCDQAVNNNKGCLQYCDKLAMAPKDGVLATDEYYQWQKSPQTKPLSELLKLECFSANNPQELGKKYWTGKNILFELPDSASSIRGVANPFSAIRLSDNNLNEQVSVGSVENYPLNMAGANEFYGCAGDCGENREGSIAETEAKRRLDDLFKKFEVWKWNETSYTKLSDYDATNISRFEVWKWNKTSYTKLDDYDVPNISRNEVSAVNKYPKIGSVSCTQQGICSLINEGRFTIGEKDEGNIIRSRDYPAIIKFYAWADKDHMPLREISIDWSGKGELNMTSQYQVKIKNHKDECVGDDFGNSVNGCKQGYFQFTYIYTCGGQGSPGWNNNCPIGVINACCFKPIVYLKDNWGWCNGNNTYAGDGSCSALSNGIGGNDYNGVIVIYP